MLFPQSFHAPSDADLGMFSVRLLGPDDAQADYRAVTSSASRIRGVFGPSNDWPAASLTFEENANDLERHLTDSRSNRSIAYSIWMHQEYAGCLYIKPFKSRIECDRRRGIHRELCFLWVAEDFVRSELAIYGACKDWIGATFPVSAVVWPGREIGWSEWQALA